MEINCECPESMASNVSKVLQKCMEQGGKPFCPNVKLSTDIEIADHWVH